MTQKPLKIITVVVIAIVLVLLLAGRSNHKASPVNHANINNINEAVANNFNDSLRAVTAELNETNKKIAHLEQENKALEKTNKTLLKGNVKREEGGAQFDASGLHQELAALKAELLLLKNKTAEKPTANSYPVEGEEFTLNNSRPIQYVVDIDEEQSKMRPTQAELSYWEHLDKSRRQLSTNNNSSHHPSNKKKKGIPYYTIPAGSDLGGTVLLSAIIGEVPNDNKLAQPLFPFSAMVSRGALMSANGVPLPPDIKGMKVGGYAIGVGSFLDNISCARAYVTSVLFVFQDGHYETIGQEQMKSASEMVDNKALGYLTNPFGNPCIRGTYYTNAPQVLAVMTGAGVAQGVGKGLSQSQMSYSVGGGGIAGAPTGSAAKIMLGSGLSEATVKVADWLENRVKGSFDMVFVPASIPYKIGNQVHFKPYRLTLHITKTLEINKNTEGRRLGYGRKQNYIYDHALK